MIDTDPTATAPRRCECRNGDTGRCSAVAGDGGMCDYCRPAGCPDPWADPEVAADA